MKRTSRKLSLHRETLLGLDAEAEARLARVGGGASAPVSCQFPCNNTSRGSNCCPTLGCD